jgi:hypothetical protein
LTPNEIADIDISTHQAIVTLAENNLRKDAALDPLTEYIEKRVVPGVQWYQKHGDRAERMYLSMQATAVVFGALVPVLINVGLPNVPIPTVTTILSLIVVILVALEGVLHYRDRYRNYRSTAHALEKESFLLFARAAPYDKCTDDAGLYAQFVKNTEAYVGKEVDSTLKIMTVSSAEKEGTLPNGGTQQGTQQGTEQGTQQPGTK